MMHLKVWETSNDVLTETKIEAGAIDGTLEARTEVLVDGTRHPVYAGLVPGMLLASVCPTFLGIPRLEVQEVKMEVVGVVLKIAAGMRLHPEWPEVEVQTVMTALLDSIPENGKKSR